VASHPSPIPRIAIWHLWSDTQATGWLRMALDREKIPYAYIRDEEIRAGHLRDQFDVLLYGDNEESWKDQVQGIDTKWGPMPYTKTAQFPSHGVPDASDDITGGIGWAGMANLQEYLTSGGLMIAIGNGSALPLEGGLVRGVSVRSGGAYTPGSEIRASDIPRDILEGAGTLLPARLPAGPARGGEMGGPELEFLLRNLMELRLQVEDLKRRMDQERSPVRILDLGEKGEIGEISVAPLDEGDPDQVVYRPGMTMAEVEKAAIIAALKEFRGNRRRAAEQLGIGERTLYRKLKAYDLE